jgi:hypothetical protein
MPQKERCPLLDVMNRKSAMISTMVEQLMEDRASAAWAQ